MIDASGTVSLGKRDADRKRHGERVGWRMSIADGGKGFDWSQFLDLDVTRSADGHGRGIALAKAISFHKLGFRGCGNQLVVSVSLKGIDAESWPEEKRKVA